VNVVKIITFNQKQIQIILAYSVIFFKAKIFCNLFVIIPKNPVKEIECKKTKVILNSVLLQFRNAKTLFSYLSTIKIATKCSPILSISLKSLPQIPLYNNLIYPENSISRTVNEKNSQNLGKYWKYIFFHHKVIIFLFVSSLQLFCCEPFVSTSWQRQTQLFDEKNDSFATAM